MPNNEIRDSKFLERKDMIYNFITDKAYRPMKFKEMAGFLNIAKADRNDLRLMLEELMLEGRVVLDAAGRYRGAHSDKLEGTFRAIAGRSFGFVHIEGDTDDVFIGEDDVNTAHDLDTVLISIKDGKYGKSREGVVLEVIERANEFVVGTFEQSRGFGFVIPDNRKFGEDIYIKKDLTKGAMTGHKVVVRLLGYGDKKHNPEGEITEILGHINDPGIDIISIVRAYGIPEEFPPAVMQELSKIPSEVSEEASYGRTDYRGLLTVTIDGEDAKDLDDAVTLERKGDNYLLGVHIADVSEYVKEDSPLDKEALNRGTSCYLINKVVPMLPHKLSNGICSLNAGVDRLALSCVMEIDKKGNVIGYEITESVIRVDRRMSYNEVYGILEAVNNGESSETDEYIELLLLMKELSGILRSKREARGSLDFDFPETKISLDEEGRPIYIGPYERNYAHKIIEDFMLAANETVAEDFFWQELPFVYRNHETPDEEKLHKLSVFIRNFGYRMKADQEKIHPKEVQKLLNRISGTQEEMLISRLTLRSMKQAKYFNKCEGHFGLAAKYYCHFTSPIRRYPDLQIHRIIKENLQGKLNEKRIVHYNSILEEVSNRSSRTERRAEEAEREVEKLKKAEYMEQHIGEVFTGVISGVTSYGMYVELPNTIEGMIRVADLTDDYYNFSESEYAMIGERCGKVYRLGEKLKVCVLSVDKLLKTIDFMPAEDEFQD